MSQPRYLQIKNAILEKIQSGALQPDDKIPSEHKLAKQFSVSRLTVQRAIRELVSEGLLRRTQGSGTFVNSFTHRFSLVEVRDVVDEIAKQGGAPSSEVLLQRRIVPPPEIDELLELEEGQEVFHVAVLQSMDGEPVAHEERFAVVDVYNDFLDQDFTKRSVFDYLAARSVLEDIENVVAAVHVDRRLAESYFEIAQFYDKIEKKPKAALQEYRKLVERFENSEWTDKAKQRIEQLEMNMEGASED